MESKEQVLFEENVLLADKEPLSDTKPLGYDTYRIHRPPKTWQGGKCVSGS